jgi:uncharacterized protein
MRTVTSLISIRVPLVSAALAAFVLSSTACTTNTFVRSAAAPVSAPTGGVTVEGVGKVSGKPDIARGNIGFEARATTAEAAIGEVNRRMAQVIAAVKQAGVAEKDIRTDTIALNFERVSEPPQPLAALAPTAASAAAVSTSQASARPGTSKPASPAPVTSLPLGFYNATNSVAVTIRNLSQTGQVLSAATAAGANQLYGLHFEIEDPSPLLVEARQKAVADAHDRAERLARLAGVKLGAPLSISERNDDASRPSPYAPQAMRMDSAPVPVELGQIGVSASVVIVYALPESSP